jgi:hypothetical protein
MAHLKTRVQPQDQVTALDALARQIHILSPLVAVCRQLGLHDPLEAERDRLAEEYLRQQLAQRWPDRTVQS